MMRRPVSLLVAVRVGAWRPAGMAAGSWLALLAAFVLASPSLEAQAGGGNCDVPSHQGFTSIMLSNGTRVLYFSQPVMRCPGGTRITADSAVVYESTRYNQLFGNVVFVEGDSRLRANEAQYFEGEGRLVAWGDPILTDQAEGSVIRGDTMVFVRANEWQPEDRLTVTGRRPHATLYPARRPAPESEPSLPSDTLPTGEGELPVPDSLIMAAGGPPAPDSLGGVPPLPDSVAALAVVSDTAARRRPDIGEPPRADSLVSPPREAVVAAVQDAPAGSVPQEPAERVPYEVYAQRIVLEGSRYFRATGSVEITRDSLDAEAESVEFDQDAGFLILREAARVKTSNTDLRADTIRLDLPEDEIREVHAWGNGILEGEDVRVLGPVIRLFLTEGRLERLVAVRDAEADSILLAMEEPEPPPEQPDLLTLLPEVLRELGLTEFPRRPLAVAEDFHLVADSIEVLAPGEILNELRAMGRARGEAVGRDSLNTPDTPSILLVDWLEGDTIVATFAREGDAHGDAAPDTLVLGGPPFMALPDTVGPDQDLLPWVEDPEAQADSSEARYHLDRLVARVAARSLYRMEASDSTAREEGLLAIHYVIGDEIVMLFSNGEIERMEVENARGTHMEPVARQRRVEEPSGAATPPGTGDTSPSGVAGEWTAGTGDRSPPGIAGQPPPGMEGRGGK